MNIWIFHNYSMLPEHGQLNRPYYFGKYLAREGHSPVVFAGSHPHNTALQLIEGKEAFKVYQNEPFPWVLVKTCNYEGSKVKRVWSMFEYYFHARKAAKSFEKPDVIIGSSAHPLAALLAVQLGKKYHAKSVVEIRDLWPESIVAYGIAGARNPLVLALRHFEKWLYVHADELIFTMEGAYDYIVELGWEKQIPREKVHYINNGVDLEAFDSDRERFTVSDPDLEDPRRFKVVYTGSVRKVNNLGLLLDAAKLIEDEKIRFLIWGDGDEVSALQERVEAEKITNVIYKGRVEKKYIPFITSSADLNIAHNTPSPLFRFGVSFNKLFEYMAAGKPILSDFPCAYNPAVQCGAGTDVREPTAENVARAVEHMANADENTKRSYGENARKTAENEYDFRILTEKLIDVLKE